MAFPLPNSHVHMIGGEYQCIGTLVTTGIRSAGHSTTSMTASAANVIVATKVATARDDGPAMELAQLLESHGVQVMRSEPPVDLQQLAAALAYGYSPPG